MSEHGGIADSARSSLVRRAPSKVRRSKNLIVTIALAMSDILVFEIAALVFRTAADLPRFHVRIDDLGLDRSVDVFYALCAAFVVVRYISGDYSRRLPFWEGVRLTTISVMFVALPVVMLTLFGGHTFSTVSQISSWLFVICTLPLARQMSRYLLSRASLWWLPSALIVEGLDVSEVIRALGNSLSLGFDIRCHVKLDANLDKSSKVPGISSITLREPANIVARLVEAGCSEILIATDYQENATVEGIVQHALSARIGVAFIPPSRHRSLLGVTVNYLYDREYVPMPVHSNMVWALKRFIDIVGSAALLIVLSPILLVIGLLVRRDGGNAFFVQRRVGLNGEEFPCVKFRTMDVDAESKLTHWRQINSPLYQEYRASNFKLRDDPRVTPIGRTLRRLSLDELPQLLNVLRGDMSLVGPRPLLPREVSEYGLTYKLYSQFRPGITGLWQVSGRSNTTFSDRVSLDYCYIRNWSLFFDLVILFKTFGVLVSKSGAY